MKNSSGAPTVATELRGEVLLITLSRPDKLNAWDAAMRGRVGELLELANTQPEVRAVVVTGEGNRAFCAGADLNEVGDLSADGVRESIIAWRLFYQRILNFEKPLVAALNGVAAGSGFQAALMADFRVAHPGVTMGQTEILSGIPSVTGTTLMLRRLGAAVAGELALSGRLFDVTEAQRLGLLSRVVPEAEVLSEAISLAREMGSRSSEAVRQTKAWLHQSELRDIEAAYDFAEKAQTVALSAGDMSARVSAFVNKRKPRTPSSVRP